MACFILSTICIVFLNILGVFSILIIIYLSRELCVVSKLGYFRYDSFPVLTLETFCLRHLSNLSFSSDPHSLSPVLEPLGDQLKYASLYPACLQLLCQSSVVRHLIEWSYWVCKG